MPLSWQAEQKTPPPGKTFTPRQTQTKIANGVHRPKCKMQYKQRIKVAAAHLFRHFLHKRKQAEKSKIGIKIPVSSRLIQIFCNHPIKKAFPCKLVVPSLRKRINTALRVNAKRKKQDHHTNPADSFPQNR